MTFVSTRAPNDRVAELVGMLGTGGFIGSVVGTLLGDLPVRLDHDHLRAGRLDVRRRRSARNCSPLPFAWAATHEKREDRPCSGRRSGSSNLPFNASRESLRSQSSAKERGRCSANPRR